MKRWTGLLSILLACAALLAGCSAFAPNSGSVGDSMAEPPAAALAVAKSAATKVAMAESPGDGVAATHDYYDQLQRPEITEYVRVWTPREGNFIREEGGLQINFIVQNLKDTRIPMVEYSIHVAPAGSGWRVTGVSSGG